MIYTAKGEFENLAHLRYAYLMAYDGNPPIARYWNADPWDATTLHISELGKCARKQMLRLMGTEPKTRTAHSLWNDQLMFYQGNMIHALTVGACYWARIAVEHEGRLPGLPDGWSGHFDMTYLPEANTKVCWDGKSVRPNAFNFWYSWPKIEERRQMQGYLRFLPDVNYGEVEHIDRGGSNKPFLSTVLRNDEWVDAKMKELDDYRQRLSHYGELPDPLTPQLEATYRKQPNVLDWSINKILYKNSWQCEWCEYHWASNVGTDANPHWFCNEHSPCKPEMIKEEVGTVKKGTLSCDPERLDEISDWLRLQVTSYTHPDAELEGDELPF